MLTIAMTTGAVAAVVAFRIGSRRKLVECRRAIGEYRDLVDHRIANPLSAIEGAVETLLAADLELSADDREQLLRMIAEQAKRLEHVSLSPRVSLGSEECCFIGLTTTTSLM